MKTKTPYIAPDCEQHRLHQLQFICASDWRQNDAYSRGYDYFYDEEYELY